MDKSLKIQNPEMIPYKAVTEDGLFLLEGGYFAYTFALQKTSGNIPQNADYRTWIAWAGGMHDFQVSVYNNGSGLIRCLTIKVEADTPAQAREQIVKVRDNFNKTFADNGVPLRLVNTSLSWTLSLFYTIYHNFAPWAYGDISSSALSKKGLSTKDIAGAKKLDIQRGYVGVDGGVVKTLALNSYPNKISNELTSVLSSPPAHTVVTAHYHAINPYTVIEDLNEELSEYKGDMTGKGYPNPEEVTAKEGALALLEKAVEAKQPIYKVSVLIGLFADNADSLSTKDVDRLLSRAYCRTVSIDYAQDKALQSLLPLAQPSVEVGRYFSLALASLLLPGMLGGFPTVDIAQNNADLFTVKAKPASLGKNIKRKTTQETVPYFAAYLNDGIFENKPGTYSKAYRFSDINYHTATEEDQITFLERYAQLLNRLDSNLRCQVLIANKNIDMKAFKENNTLKMKGDGLDLYRKEYNAMILSKMQEGRNSLQKERYFILSTEAEDIDAARRAFSRLDPEMKAAFKDIGGVVAETLTAPERLELMFDIYNPGHEGEFLAASDKMKAFDADTLTGLGMTTKDMIVPSCFDFKKDYFIMGDKYCRVLYLTELPNSLSDKFMAELTAINCNLAVSINLECMRQDKAVNFTKRQLTNINVVVQKAQQTASKNGYSMELVPAEVTQAQREANELLSGLTSANQKMFIMTFTVLVYGDSLEELNVNTETVKTTGRKFLCNIKPLQMQQEDGLTACLPLCYNKLPVKRTLTTNSTIIFVPFDVQELNEPHGIYYGQNASSRNLIIYNRKEAQNSNGWILGTTGSGKSFSAKREITSVMLNTDDDVLIIDPEREYSPLAQAFGGSVVRIAPGSKWHLNPLDLDPDYDDGDDPIVLKSDFIISLCETAVGGRYGLDPVQNSIIDRCVRIVYKDFVSKYNMDPEHTPTLLDFQRVLESQPEMAAKELAIALEIYTKGALDVFAHKSNVDINNRFVVYDIKDIGSSSLSTLAYLVVLDNIWDRVIKNRRLGKRTWVYMDEIYVLFQHEQSTNFIRQIFSRGRKYGSIMTALTQNVSTILNNVVATTMLSNSAFVELLNQAPADKALLVDLLTISPQQANFITDARQGHGLLYVQNVGIVPFEDDFPKQICPELYKVMTSKPDELLTEFR